MRLPARSKMRLKRPGARGSPIRSGVLTGSALTLERDAPRTDWGRMPELRSGALTGGALTLERDAPRTDWGRMPELRSGALTGGALTLEHDAPRTDWSQRLTATMLLLILKTKV
jgi:hypothetical protein